MLQTHQISMAIDAFGIYVKCSLFFVDDNKQASDYFEKGLEDEERRFRLRQETWHEVKSSLIWILVDIFINLSN